MIEERQKSLNVCEHRDRSKRNVLNLFFQCVEKRKEFVDIDKKNESENRRNETIWPNDDEIVNFEF